MKRCMVRAMVFIALFACPLTLTQCAMVGTVYADDACGND